jgi:hypothetical protein
LTTKKIQGTLRMAVVEKAQEKRVCATVKKEGR